jgi:thiamine-monophosphate kinase
VKLSALGEFGLIDRIAARVKATPGVRCGIGDDAAVLDATAAEVQLVTSDMLLEGIHFDLAWTPPALLGRKSLAVNLSDIAAMGARPRHFLLSLGLPPELPLEFVDTFIGGLLEMAGDHDVTLVGGDTCSSRHGLVISITLLGEQRPELIVRRSGASVGDLICITGSVGDAALGLFELRAGSQTGPAVSRQLDPVPRCREGLWLAEAGLPTAMIDVSDGILADLGHIVACSSVGARLDLARLPLSPYFRELAPVHASDPFEFALAGGEDYELLFTIHPDSRDAMEARFHGTDCPVTVIGEVTAGRGIEVVVADGTLYRQHGQGFRHF